MFGIGAVLDVVTEKRSVTALWPSCEWAQSGEKNANDIVASLVIFCHTFSKKPQCVEECQSGARNLSVEPGGCELGRCLMYC